LIVKGLPLVRELTPAPDPRETAARLAGLPFLIWLDSSAPVSPVSRYSFLSADPAYIIQSRKSRTIRHMPLRSESVRLEVDPLQAVYELLAPFAHEPVSDLPPFQGGAAGVLGYEFGRRLERVPEARFDDLDLPDVSLGIYDWALAWDHQSGRAWIVSTGLPAVGSPREQRARERLQFVLAALQDRTPHAVAREKPIRTRLAPSFPIGDGQAIRSTFTASRYQQAVQDVVNYILAGDVFQVNLSQRFEAPAPANPMALYGALRAINPAPFAAYLDLGEAVIASASPERFLRLDPASRLVETRPIKGTRPRGSNDEEDRQLRKELESSEKDRAENVMIVDLLRNDLSRVCQPGTVQVPSLLALETHPTVHHLVSTVTGQLEPNRTFVDLLHATFPGGSITGAPKIRAMEIIAELEPTVRGPYTGSIGYWSLTGAMDTSIVIRTYVIVGERAYFQAGGGIVADSNPAAEYQETLDKADALIRALQP
jgi:para-aminobenzoate synthetase component I